MDKYLNKKVAVLGLGIEGVDAINFLLAKGAKITLFEQKENKNLDFEGIQKAKIKIVSGKNYLSGGLKDFDYIVRSPGIYRFTPEIVEAEASGAKVTSAIKIFFEECPGKIIGVTGTKGKGTTSTLIYRILETSGKEVYLVGNIGKPYLQLLPKLSDKSWVIVELSSFQLIDMKASPHIAVVLNITQDHLDWHKDREEYLKSKENIVKYQNSSDFSVINEEYSQSKNFAKLSNAKIIFFSKNSLEQKYKVGLQLKGEHNLENIAAAVAAAKCVEIPDKIILNVVKAFRGLEHRLEFVREVNGIKFYNDSFATGPQPTIAAINSFTEPETVILGGSEKGLEFKELRKVIEQKENVRNLITIGLIGKKIVRGIKKKKIIDLGTTPMTQIVKKAFEITPKGGVVILSPAAASFDMFENYKDRGNQFKKAVQSLLNEQK